MVRKMIDENELMQNIDKIDGRKMSKKMVEAVIRGMNRTEAPAKKSGAWEPVPSTIFKCTACGGQFDFDDGRTSPFCPMCGAKMDGNNA